MDKNALAKTVLAAVLVVIVAAVLIMAVPTEPDSNESHIVHTGDTHGQESDLSFDKVADMNNGLRNSFLFDTGDALLGSGMNTLTQGQSAVAIMNAAGYDAVCLGQHDMAYGLDALKERAQEAEFPFLCANMVWKSDGKPVFADYTVIEKKGLRLGVFGLISPFITETVKPTFFDDLKVVNPVETAQDMVKVLKGKDVDFIVALGSMGDTHDGKYSAESICRSVDGIDIFLEGDNHSESGSITEVNGTRICSPGMNFSEAGVISLSDSIECTLVTSHDGSDSATADVMKQEAERNSAYLEKKVGHTDVELVGSGRLGFVSEISMAGFTADALRNMTGADIGFVNGGFIRSSIHPGDVTASMVCQALPFENYTVTFRISGADLLEAIEWGLRAYPAENGGFPQISGATVTWNPEAEPMHRVVSVQVGGETLEPAEMYTVATSDYMAAGGDGYKMFADVALKETHEVVYKTVIDYFQKIGNVEEAPGNSLTTV